MKPSVVSAIIARTQEELDQLLNRVVNFTDGIMLDIMDGVIVETYSLNFDFKLPSGPKYEAHIMTEKPLDYIDMLNSKISKVIIHAETLQNIEIASRKVKETGRDFYIALNPETCVSILKNLLHLVDGVLIMTVNPGRYGAKFIPRALNKVRILRGWDKNIPIEVDGGINPETARSAIDAGANIIASGSYIMNSENVEQAIKQLADIMRP